MILHLHSHAPTALALDVMNPPKTAQDAATTWYRGSWPAYLSLSLVFMVPVFLDLQIHVGIEGKLDMLATL